MADPPYDPGDLVTLRLALTDNDTGSPVTPSSLALHLRSPAGTLGTYLYGGASTPSSIASGVWEVDVLVDAPGTWAYRWKATGPMTAEEGSIPVASSYFVP